MTHHSECPTERGYEACACDGYRDRDELRQKLESMAAERDQARKTSAFNKDNHLAAEAEIERLKPLADAKNDLRKALHDADLQLRVAQGVILTACEVGQLNPHAEDTKCPEDDTCDCHFAAKIHEATKGYVPTNGEQADARVMEDRILERLPEKRGPEDADLDDVEDDTHSGGNNS